MTSNSSQIPFQLSVVSEGHASDVCWLGLATDHRRLLDALQDGWLRPLPSHTGILVGIGRYAAERDSAEEGHPIAIHLKLNTEKLPELEVATFHGIQWETRSIREIESSNTALYWPGVFPTFAIQEIAVSSEEECARLKGMARFASNLILPEDVVRVDTKPKDVLAPDTCPLEANAKLVIPKNEDATHGAISMAVWAVPRIDPWLDLLTTSFASDRAGLPVLANNVGASWWRFPPWASSSDNTKPSSLQDCLWLAAIDSLLSHSAESSVAPRELAEHIADTASHYECPVNVGGISAWLQSTHRILRAESTIRLDDWRSCPVGIAIQLVLTRSDPLRFKTWFQDLPDLPPAIAWSAATLCGLLHGYRRLDTYFRGDALQRELLSVHALRACAHDAREVNWPSLASDAPSWRRESGNFVLSWGGEDFARRPEKARGRWYAADLEDVTTRREAQAVAKELDWQCMNQEIVFRDTRLPLRGSGTVRAVDKPDSHLEVRGEVRLRVPEGASIEEMFDADSFRHRVAVEGGRLPDPPTPQVRDLNVEELDIPGLKYAREFLTATEEEELVATIDRCEWNSDIKRRVQHYGWRYDYKARKVDPSMHLGRLPDWAEKLAHRLVSKGLVRELPDQVIVNEYIATQGIRPHSDSPSFADGIATISLLESWEMVFREKSTKRKVNQVLERRSVAIMNGDSRYRWTHEIPNRKTAPARVKRRRRISLTFRKVIAPQGGKHKSG